MEWWTLSLISAAFSAVASIFEKKTLFSEGALVFSAALAVFNLLFTLPFAFYIDFSSIKILQLSVLFIKSILAALAFYFVMKGLKELEISSALPLLVLTPGIVALVSFAFLGEHLTKYEITGMALLLIGTYVLQTGRIRIFSTNSIRFRLKGLRFILGALFIYSATAILDKILLSRLSLPPVAFMWFEHLFFVVIFLFLFFISGNNIKLLAGTFRLSWKLILIVSLATIIYRFAQIWAVKYGSVALVLSLKRTSIFFAIVIGGKLFRDSNLLTRSIATTIMIIGAFLVVI